MEKWEKLGVIIDESFLPEWAKSHLQHPTVLKISDNTIRIYFATRDYSNQSHPIFVEYSLESRQITKIHQSPVLDLGKIGAFDEYGIMPSSFLIKSEGEILMYYFGISLDKNLPIRNAIGLAKSSDGGLTFQRFFDGPIIDRGPQVPLFASCPFIMELSTGYSMYFLRGYKWSREQRPNGKWRSFYDVAYATSEDGVYWKVEKESVLKNNDLKECAIARPFFVKVDGIEKMYFCSRWDNYSLGVAKLTNGVFERTQLSLVGNETSSWDSDSQAYPCHFMVGDTEYLLYNGNEYGQTGIGLARRLE